MRRASAAAVVGASVDHIDTPLADAGVSDIYISNEVIAPHKLAGLAALAKRITLAVAVDSEAGIGRLAQAVKAAGSGVKVFVEIDVGQGRCGVAPAAAGALAHQVVSHGMPFAGLQAYNGRAQHLRGASEREAAARNTVALVRAAQASITARGMVCPLVTGAGSGTFALDAGGGVYGELQAGSYLFMDCDYAKNEASASEPHFEHSLFVKSQVMSRGAAHAVVDAGHKAHALDSGLPRVWQRPLEYINGGDEHGILRPPANATLAELPALGDAVWLVPGHCDPTVNLHDHYVVVRGGLTSGVVEAVWPIDSRGSLC